MNYIGIVLLGAAIGFFSYYKVDSVEVRGTTHYTEDEIKKRLSRFEYEESKIDFYDYVLKNNDLEKTIQIITTIIEAEEKVAKPEF